MNLHFTDPMTWLQGTVFLALVLLALPALLPPLYLLWLTLFSFRKDFPSTDGSEPEVSAAGFSVMGTTAGGNPKFDIVVPAHDEADGISAVVDDLLQLDWPRDRFRVVVVADNCSDATAECARRAGAVVLERSDPGRRGKGHALQHAFRFSLAQQYAQAVVVVDADSRASRNLLRAFASRLAKGSEVAQVFHGVLHPDQNSRNRLMAIAYGAFHRVRSRGRERLGLSCGIRGNGWCITRRTLLRVPYAAHGLAEDIEYGLRLGIAGVRVEYVDEAQVLSSMDTDMAGAASQRNRWEQGRSSLPRAFSRPLFAPRPAVSRTLRRDLGFDLLVPPLATIALGIVLFAGVAFAACWALPSAALPKAALAASGFGTLALTLHVARGWQLSGTGLRGLRDLAMAPRFALWKLALRLRPRNDAEWIRTHRMPT
jgi:1,2-diacylglycerol 3-beta-glucosyltransferase